MEGLHNPVKAIRMPSPPSGRDRRLGPGEMEKLLESSSDELSQVIKFALETAMQRGELAGMTCGGDGESQETDADASGYEKRPEKNRSSLCRGRGNHQGTTEHSTTRRKGLGYWPGCDLTGLYQGMSGNRNFRTALPRSPARGHKSAF